jgi:selenocysteine lyase/cysteine desulfurase
MVIGPYSAGAAYFGPAFDEGRPLERNWINRIGSEEFKNLVNYQTEYRPFADRYNVGERSNFILNPMFCASLTQILDWGVENIESYCHQLLEEPLKLLQEKGFWVDDLPYRSKHLVGLRIPPQADIARIQASLKARNVQVSFRGQAIRIAPHVYNDMNDIDALIEGLIL